MTLEIPDRIGYRKLIGQTESDAQHQNRCYHIINTNQY